MVTSTYTNAPGASRVATRVQPPPCPRAKVDCSASKVKNPNTMPFSVHSVTQVRHVLGRSDGKPAGHVSRAGSTADSDTHCAALVLLDFHQQCKIVSCKACFPGSVARGLKCEPRHERALQPWPATTTLGCHPAQRLPMAQSSAPLRLEALCPCPGPARGQTGFSCVARARFAHAMWALLWALRATSPLSPSRLPPDRGAGSALRCSQCGAHRVARS